MFDALLNKLDKLSQANNLIDRIVNHLLESTGMVEVQACGMGVPCNGNGRIMGVKCGNCDYSCSVCKKTCRTMQFLCEDGTKEGWQCLPGACNGYCCFNW